MTGEVKLVLYKGDEIMKKKLLRERRTITEVKEEPKVIEAKEESRLGKVIKEFKTRRKKVDE